MFTQLKFTRFLVWLPALAWGGLIFILSAQPDETLMDLGLSGDLLAVAGHLVMFGGLMLLIVLALQTGNQVPAARARRIAFIMVAIYGLLDEYHQSFVPGRNATVFDWIIDLSGAAIVWWIIRTYERQHQSNQVSS